MDTLLECEGACEPVHDVTCGLLLHQGAFPNKSSGDNKICFTHAKEEWQIVQNMNGGCN